MIASLHAVLRSLTLHVLVKGAVALVLHLASLALGQPLLAYEQGTSNLYRVDAETGTATLVGATPSLPGDIISLNARGHRLFGIALSGSQGARQSHLVEIDPCNGLLISVRAVTLDGDPAPGYIKALAHDDAGNLIASYSPTQDGVANVLAMLGDDGALTPLRTFTGALDDFDGLCPLIIDSGSDGQVTHAGYLAVNRDPESDAIYLLRIEAESESTALIHSYPFSQEINGLSDIALFSGVLYGVDSITNRILRLDPDSGVMLGNADLSPAVALSAVAPFSPVVITMQPRSINVCYTTDGDLSVEAACNGTPSYEWQIEAPRGVWHTLTSQPMPLPGGGTALATAPDAPNTTIRVRERTGRLLVRVIVTGPCDAVTSNLAGVFINSADFNNDGDIGTDADIEAFFACLAGNCPPTGCSADFNADGDTGTDADIESFFRVLSGGSC